MATILPTTKKVIILNAGHWDDPATAGIDDPGAKSGTMVEGTICKKIRDEVVPMLEACGFTVHQVPDNLNLAKSIQWANAKAPAVDDALAVDIHLNSSNTAAASGTEAYHGSTETSRKIGEAIGQALSAELGINYRGSFSDKNAAVGSLGWIRQTKMWATLIEVAFISNARDMAVLMGSGGIEKAARGITKGICTVFGVEYSEPVNDVIITVTKGNTTQRYKATPI